MENTSKPTEETPQPSAGGPLGRTTDRLEHLAEQMGDALWQRIRRHPYLGVALAGGAGLLLAEAIGVGEAVVGLLAGAAAFRLLRRRQAPPQDLVV